MPDESRPFSKRETGIFHQPVFLAAIVAVLASFLLADLVPVYAPGLLRFEHAMADVRTSLLSDRLPSQHPHVAIVGINDDALNEFKTRLPIDRGLLARIVTALDEIGAKVIGIDVLFFRTAPADNEDMLIEAIRRARAKVVLAAADERLGLSQAEINRQSDFMAKTGRPAGHVYLATERDWVVRFKAAPAPGTKYPRSFAEMLAEAGGYPARTTRRRIAWLGEPLDGSETFVNVPATALLGPADNPAIKALRDQLKDKIVIVGGLLPDLDQHLTPLSARTHQTMAGAMIHAHILAESIDGRSIGQLEGVPLVLRLGLAALAAFGFLIGWRYRLQRQGILLGSLATIVILTIDTFVFWQFRIILPTVLALLAWFMGEFSGHNLGRWLGHRPDRAMWFGK